jgi:YebC/PmpR family DNA-binding regulatory protein
MSGHSHAKTIQHKKAVEDKKRGKIFSKISKMIIMAVKEKGKDPETNIQLRAAIEKAKEFNMPKDNIERAIKRGAGEMGDEKLEEFSYEAYGPQSIALIIEGITDNKNRTLSEVKQILGQHNGKLANAGSVKYLFEKKGAEWMPKYPLQVDEKTKERLEKLFETLDENDDVQEIYSNLK